MHARPHPQRVPRVLVVDDVKEVRQAFADFLSRAGMDVTQADGASSALVAARCARPDLVVTDIAMPEMDGLELCRQIRAEPTTAAVPVLVVSGDLSGEGDAAREAGCDAVLAKPCSRALLVATVRRLLSSKTPARREAPL